MFTLVCAWIKKHAKAMLSKNKRGYEIKTVPFRKRFRANLSDAYLAGSLTAARAASLFTDAQSAGAGGIEDLAGLGEKNANRSLKRRLLKNNHWPKLYWADIPIFDPKQQIQESVPMPFILPHELVATFFQWGEPEFILGQQVLQEDADLLARHAAACQPPKGPKTLFPLGIWSDGAPCNSDRTQSLEVVAMSFPSLPGIRVPLFVIKKCFQIKQRTMDSIFRVLQWSFEHLALGMYPNRRHDNTAFPAKKEMFRLQLVSKALPCCGVLTQFRGDWKMLKDTFYLPQHNETKGCCWLCPCVPEMHRQAAWRQTFFDEWSYVMRCWQEPRPCSPFGNFLPAP